jgi:predicted enzyme related to lactoylglutathione lyase
MSATQSRFIWYELMTSDVAKAKAFYGEVVGWTTHLASQDGPEYWGWMKGAEGVGGLMALTSDMAAGGAKPGWLGYLGVDDVDTAVKAIGAAGGQVHLPAWDIPGVGRIAMVSDPQGAPFYVMKPIGEGVSTAFAPRRAGHGGWNELHTTDWSAAADFYGAQFGFARDTAMDMGPMGTYQLFNTGGGEPAGGMMNSSAFGRPAWLYYFNVDDVAAAKARIEAAGGQVLHGPAEVPGGMVIIQASDPQGAMFALVGPGA